MAKQGSGLARIKEWFTVAEAAAELSKRRDEEVTEADIFQFAVQRRLTISVRFLDRVTAIYVPPSLTLLEPGEAELERDGGPVEFPDFPLLHLPGDVYDLPMTGVERLEIERQYQRRSGGPTVIPQLSAVVEHDGPFVKSSSTGKWFRLQEEMIPDPHRLPAKGMPAPHLFFGGYLPPDTVYVVRPAALEALAPAHTVKSANAPVHSLTEPTAAAAKVDFQW